MTCVEGFAAGPLSDYQFAPVLFLEGHGLVEGDDRAVDLIVRWWLRRDALQPEPGGGHHGE